MGVENLERILPRIQGEKNKALPKKGWGGLQKYGWSIPGKHQKGQAVLKRNQWV